MVMITLALTMIFEGFVGYTFSTMPLLFPKAISGDPLQIFGVIIDKHDLFTFIVSIIIVIVLFIILYKTKIGIAARSLAEDEFGARILGIPINSIYLFIWMTAFAIAGVSGILVAGRQTLEPHFMVVIQLKGFMAAVLGGMNSIIGSVLGGFLLGMIENLVSFYIPQIKDSFSLILIVLVLLFLPQGIFGKKEGKEGIDEKIYPIYFINFSSFPPLILRETPSIIGYLNLVMIYGISAQGLNLLLGIGGQISLGHAAFMAIGGYTSAIFVVHYNFPFIIALIISIVVSAIFGLIVGFPSLRLKGFYLAIATMALGNVVGDVLRRMSITGGDQGFRNYTYF